MADCAICWSADGLVESTAFLPLPCMMPCPMCRREEYLAAKADGFLPQCVANARQEECQVLAAASGKRCVNVATRWVWVYNSVAFLVCDINHAEDESIEPWTGWDNNDSVGVLP